MEIGKNVELAYLAGIFDGEGYIKIGSRNYFGVGICMTHLPTLKKFRDHFGGKIRQRKPRKSNKKNLFIWELYQIDSCLTFLVKLIPYLSIKEKQAKAVLALLEAKKKHYQAADLIKISEVIARVIRDLNKTEFTIIPGVGWYQNGNYKERTMIYPPKDKVVVYPIFDPDRIGSIYIPEVARERCDQGIIAYKGKKVSDDIQIGDYVLFSGYSGTLVNIEGYGRFIILPEDFLICKLDSEEINKLEIPGIYFKNKNGEYFTATYETIIQLMSLNINEEDLAIPVKGKENIHVREELEKIELK